MRVSGHFCEKHYELRLCWSKEVIVRSLERSFGASLVSYDLIIRSTYHICMCNRYDVLGLRWILDGVGTVVMVAVASSIGAGAFVMLDKSALLIWALAIVRVEIHMMQASSWPFGWDDISQFKTTWVKRWNVYKLTFFSKWKYTSTQNGNGRLAIFSNGDWFEVCFYCWTFELIAPFAIL